MVRGYLDALEHTVGFAGRGLLLSAGAETGEEVLTRSVELADQLAVALCARGWSG